MLHVSASRWYSTDVNSFEWKVFNFYDSIVRWPTPIFVMISGALFLDRDFSLKKIFSKNILRIVTAFIFWSCVYAAVRYSQTKKIFEAVKILFGGSYHMWFLFTAIGLYITIPFMKKISEDKFLTKYFLLLAFIFAIMIPQSVNILRLFSEDYGKLTGNIFNKFNLKLPIGYTGYFLLGYVLNKKQISKRVSRIIYIAGICGFLLTIFMTLEASLMKNKATEIFYQGLTFNVMLEIIAMFVFFKNNFSKNSQIIAKLSKYSFGAYLVHVEVIRWITHYLGFNTLSINPVISVPAISCLTFLISFLISGILNNITVLKKYIV